LIDKPPINRSSRKDAHGVPFHGKNMAEEASREPCRGEASKIAWITPEKTITPGSQRAALRSHGQFEVLEEH